MKETGIIMSGNHPLKVIDGTKTMTRRTYGLEGINQDPDRWISATPIPENRLLYSSYKSLWQFTDKDGVSKIVKCPYGGIRDRLIIKETWATENRYNHLKPSEIPDTAKIYYINKLIHSAGGYSLFTEMGKVRSAMFMCNWMSRARPEITEVRVERVKEISEGDAQKEGAKCYWREGDADWGLVKAYINAEDWAKAIGSSYSLGFQVLWDSLNAKRGYGWDFNSWVFPISFKVVN